MINAKMPVMGPLGSKHHRAQIEQPGHPQALQYRQPQGLLYHGLEMAASTKACRQLMLPKIVLLLL